MGLAMRAGEKRTLKRKSWGLLENLLFSMPNVQVFT
jgi:hypothetical protein